MSLLIVYIFSVIVGQSVSITVGLLVDRYFSSYTGLMVFIAMYFVVFWLAWRFSVRVTAPKSPRPQGGLAPGKAFTAALDGLVGA